MGLKPYKGDCRAVLADGVCLVDYLIITYISNLLFTTSTTLTSTLSMYDMGKATSHYKIWTPLNVSLQSRKALKISLLHGAFTYSRT